MELVVRLDNVAVAPAVRCRYEQAETDVGATDAAGCLNVFCNVGRKTYKEHRIEFVHVNAVTDRGCGDDIPQ